MLKLENRIMINISQETNNQSSTNHKKNWHGLTTIDVHSHTILSILSTARGNSRHSRGFIPAGFVRNGVVVVNLPISTGGCSPRRHGWGHGDTTIRRLSLIGLLLLIHGLSTIILLLRHSILLSTVGLLLSKGRISALAVCLVGINTLTVRLLLVTLKASILILGSIWNKLDKEWE